MHGTLGQGSILRIIDCGTVPYRDALTLQHDLVRRRQAGEIPDTLLLLEHPPVITMGRSGVDEHVLAPPETLAAAGATVERIERGGEATYHGPGQLVGYPILDLRAHLRSLKKFVHLLEEVFVVYLEREFGITAGRDDEHRGVWVANEKITAVGIAVQQRVTFHGFAFNVNTDLSHFDWIIPCGITDRGQTSLERLTGAPQEMSRVKDGLSRVFAEIFGYRWDGITGVTDPHDID
jgi:lipoyl(octanoyl) transferase